jgi:hypothetical protein
VIISASYKTDIPAFYSPWFMRRLHAGYCKTVNPYGRQVYTLPLTPDVVDGFVFWTKNIGPFLDSLPQIQRLGYPFVVQYTITGYPRELEERVLDAAHTVASLRALADRYGPAVPVWRYDPILITSLTPPAWHRRNFASLARSLQGATDEVVVSFAQVYKKARRNLNEAAHTSGFTWHEHEMTPPETARELVAELAGMAASYGMRLTICSQHMLHTPGVTQEARCVDAERLERVSGKSLLGRIKLQGNRAECGCYASRDIGEYDTCPHGCVYCYAVLNRDLALAHYKAHDPEGEFLFPPRSLPKEPVRPLPLLESR